MQSHVAKEANPPSPAGPVVFFDGVCGLCNGFVDFVMGRDRSGMLHFSPLQGATAMEVLGKERAQAVNSVLFWDGGRVYEKSEAALRVVAGLGGIWAGARLVLIFPKGFRDAVYDAIADHRYRWFGKKDSCRLPTAGERARFLP